MREIARYIINTIYFAVKELRECLYPKTKALEDRLPWEFLKFYQMLDNSGGPISARVLAKMMFLAISLLRKDRAFQLPLILT